MIYGVLHESLIQADTYLLSSQVAMLPIIYLSRAIIPASKDITWASAPSPDGSKFSRLSRNIDELVYF